MRFSRRCVWRLLLVGCEKIEQRFRVNIEDILLTVVASDLGMFGYSDEANAPICVLQLKRVFAKVVEVAVLRSQRIAQIGKLSASGFFLRPEIYRTSSDSGGNRQFEHQKASEIF